MKTIRKTDILVPADCDFSKWSVVACDQFTSERKYWKDLEEKITRFYYEGQRAVFTSKQDS